MEEKEQKERPRYSNKELLVEFIDAAELDREKARRMLAANPELLEARGMNGETALHFLAIENYLAGVTFLIEVGADVNTTDDFGNSALHHARMQGYREMAGLLESRGAISLEYFEPGASDVKQSGE